MWEKLIGKTYQDLDGFDAIYLMGGSTFDLLNELRSIGFLTLIESFLQSGRVIYGISAGAILLGNNISTTTLGPEGEEPVSSMNDLSGLNLLSGINIYPHYLPAQDEELLAYLEKSRIPFLAIPETSGVYVNEGSWTALGYDPVYLFKGGEKKAYNPNTNIRLD